MSYGPCDLRMVEALAERRLLTARRTGPGEPRLPRARGRPSATGSGRGRVAFPQPAAGAAGRH